MKKSRERLTGKVSTYSSSVKSGIIVSNNSPYLFTGKEWLSRSPPETGQEVLFIAERNWAISIMLVSPDTQNEDL
jgi:hypothetical protein